jgi:hypothetical protein
MITKFVKWFQRLIEREVLALTLGEPIPLAEFAFLIRQTYPIWKINGAKPFGRWGRR